MKKRKSGAFLRWSGKPAGVPVAQLVETKAPHPDSPAGMFAELNAEDRKPQFYHLAQRTHKP